MKKTLLTTIISIVIIAMISLFGGNYVINKTSDDNFCISCHSWMDPMGKAYALSPHGGASHLGIKASCASCHLPHDDSTIAYTFKKAMNGISEVTHMVFNDASKHDWMEHRKNREDFVYDSGCLSCHKNIENAPAKNENIKAMHQKYSEFKNAKGDEKLSCVSCHKTVGHEDLTRILYEMKNPPVGNWEDK